MLIALDRHHKQCLAETATNGSYYCPMCLKPVYLKKGPIKISHFAHEKKCVNPVFSEGETLEHLNGKSLLYRYFLKAGYKVMLEAYLPNLSQRPDLLVYNETGKMIAIEFQCSPISIASIKKRTEVYLKNNIQVVWLVGEKNKKNSGNHYSYALPELGWFYLNSANQQLYLLTHYEETAITINDLLRFPIKPVEKVVCTQSTNSPYAWRRRVANDFLKKLYEERIPLDKIPKCLFCQQHNQSGLRSPFSYFLVYGYACLVKEKRVTIRRLLDAIKNALKNQLLSIDEMPCVHLDNFLLRVIYDMLSIYKAFNLVKEIKENVLWEIVTEY